MRYLLCLLSAGLWLSPICAQELGYNIALGFRKTIKRGDHTVWYLRNQFQLTPVISKYPSPDGDWFNDDGFWAIPDRQTNTDGGIFNPGGYLDDSPRQVELEWRNTASVQYTRLLTRWFRSNNAYALFFNGAEWRHSLRTELDYRPMRHSTAKKKVDIALRNLFQVNGRPDDDAPYWTTSMVPRADVEWTFKPNHILSVTNALNGAIDNRQIQFDRWRFNANLIFMYEKIHRFTLGYQFQQQLTDSRARSQGLNLAYEIRI